MRYFLIGKLSFIFLHFLTPDFMDKITNVNCRLASALLADSMSPKSKHIHLKDPNICFMQR